MTTFQLILLILAGVAAVWQVAIILAGFILLAKYGGNVKFGILPGIIAVILVIIVVLL